MSVIAVHPGWVKTDMGGEAAPLEKAQSVSGIVKVLTRITLKESGSFLSYTGRVLAW